MDTFWIVSDKDGKMRYEGDQDIGAFLYSSRHELLSYLLLSTSRLLSPYLQELIPCIPCAMI